MRIGFDVTPAALSRAGVGRYARELRRALGRVEGLSVEELGLDHPRPQSATYRVMRGLQRELLYYPFLMRREVARQRLDLVHCPGPFGPRVSQPLVLTVHDLLPWRHPELFTKANVLQQRLVVQGAVRRAAHLVVGSQYVQSELGELFDVPPDRIAVTRWGISERFHPTELDPEWLRSRFGIALPFVLSVGTLEPRKNLRTLLAAFERVGAEMPEASLVLAGGTGWKNEEFEAALEHSQARIVLTGYVDDDELVRLYGSASCFVFPSLYEGVGLPPLEAMACGTPVVAGDRTSLPEIVGDAGILVDVRDQEALAGAISSVLLSQDLAASLREKGLARAPAFTWAECARTTANVYRDTLGS
jgi:glycosyltransferase involved in cell wall biosynthesis